MGITRNTHPNDLGVAVARYRALPYTVCCNPSSCYSCSLSCPWTPCSRPVLRLPLQRRFIRSLPSPGPFYTHRPKPVDVFYRQQDSKTLDTDAAEGRTRKPKYSRATARGRGRDPRQPGFGAYVGVTYCVENSFIFPRQLTKKVEREYVHCRWTNTTR